MNHKEALTKIAELLGVKTSQKFGEMKLSDGMTVISFDGEMLAVGAEVWVISEDGKQPAPDGQHKLETGMLITVVNGIVTEIAEPTEEEEVTEEVVEEEMAEDAPANVTIEMLASLEDRIAALEAKLSESVEANEEFSNQLKEVTKIVAEIAEEPANEPIQQTSQNFSKADMRFNKMQEIIKNLKK